MTSAARLREADRASSAFQIALAKIGAATIEDALELWSDVSTEPERMAVTADRWLGEALQLILGRRGMSSALALAFYRLVRALRTGYTVARPGEPVRTQVTLEQLRREFSLLVRDVDTFYDGPVPDESGDVVAMEEVAQGRDEYDHLREAEGNGEVIREETLDVKDEIDANEQRRLDEDEVALEALGPRDLQRRLAKVDQEQSARQAKAQERRAFEQAGARQAATAARSAMNGGRDVIARMLNADRRSLGYIRVSLSGDPCGWCAMLISRGAVYRSAQAAQHRGKDQSEDKYHDNCNCIVEPVFSRAQLESERYALNRELDSLWQEHVAKKFGGDAAVAEFRRLMRARSAQSTSAQEARK